MSGNSNPSSIARHEGHFKGQGGIELFFQTWTPKKVSGTLVITHGISEHSECYLKTANQLAGLGWQVCAWDLRGHGRSEGKRGFVGEFKHYVEDLAFFLNHLKSLGRLDQPFAIFGHSMGGLVTLRLAIDDSLQIPKPGAMVLSSPLLGVALPVPKIKDAAARILVKVLPTITLFNEIRYEDLSRDSEHLKSYATDPLRHDKISPSLYLGMFTTIEEVIARAQALNLPTLVQAAGNEKIVSLPAIRTFFDRIGTKNKKLIVYDESLHEIYNDLDRELVINDLNNFLVPALGLKESK